MRRVVVAAGLGWVVMAAAGCTGEQGVLGSELGNGDEAAGAGQTETAAAGSAGADAGQRSLMDFVDLTFVDTKAAETDTYNGRCINSTYYLYDNGVLGCRVALIMPGGQCKGPSVASADTQLAAVAKSQLEARGCSDDSVPCDARVCELLTAAGDNLDACLSEQSPPDDFSGWCFVDPVRGIGDEDLTTCPLSDTGTSGLLRFSIAALPSEVEAVLFACAAETQSEVQSTRLRHVGEECTPRDEYEASFSSFGLDDITIDDDSTSCASGICLVNHFQGRVSCPYGQTQDRVSNIPLCWVPSTADEFHPVETAVAPQLVDRQNEDAVTCSCRCDGPGPGPYCACPEGTECVHLIDDLGEELSDYAGSYCIKEGTAYDPKHKPSPETCDPESMNCSETG